MNQMNLRRSGMDLRLMRVKADLKVLDVARAMKVNPSQVSRIETSRNVTDKAWARYVEALATFPTVITPADGPEAA